MKLPIETIARIAKENHVLEQLSYTHAGHCVPWYEIQHKDYLIEFVNAISEATIREAQDGNEVEQISEKSKLPYPVTIAGGTVGKGCSWSTLILRIDSFNKAHSKTPNNSEVDELKAKLDEVNQNFDMAHTTLKVAVQALAWADGHLDDVLLKKTIANVQKTFEALTTIGDK